MRRAFERRPLLALSGALVSFALVVALAVGGITYWLGGLTGDLALAGLAHGYATQTSTAMQPPTSHGAISLGAQLPTPLPTNTLPVPQKVAWGGGFPSYYGPISPALACPHGQAPNAPHHSIYSASSYGAPTRNTVALTFDDGPTPYTSPPILSYLKQTHTPATFFVLGQYARAWPDLVRREAADGFTIGIHSWSHPDMRTLTPAQRAWQLEATLQQVHYDVGSGLCLWLWRQPYGDSNQAIINQAGQFGLTSVLWNVDPTDWSRPGTQVIVNRVLAQVRPGSIILMHDGPALRQETAAALPLILAGLRARGLTPVSLPQLFQGYDPSAVNTVTAG
jgi:peptidoglycan/xylan/chitin deacetylase (PgdA/CDA1 family)